MSGNSLEHNERLQKERMVKAARMYGMCQKAEFEDPMLPVSLALAAFEQIPLKEAAIFVRTNRVNIEDMAWALTHSSSAEEFEDKLRERIASMKRRSGQGGGAGPDA